MFRRLLSSSLFALSLACASAEPVEVDEVVTAEDGDLGKADGSSELKVRVGGTSVWLRSSLTVRDDALVLRGRASRNFVDARAFVMDDPYGDVAIVGPRTFEVTWPLSTARGLLDGVDLFLGLGFVHSSSRPDNLTARAVVRPRLSGFAGSSEIYLVAALEPEQSAGRVVYRLRGSTRGLAFSVDVRAGERDLGVARLVDDDRFEIDLDPATALEIMGEGTPITVRAHVVGGLVEKSAVLGASLHRLALTEGDAYEVWPRECTDDTRECLEELAPGTLDLGACGDAFAVTACAGTLGTFVTADDVDTRLAAVDARIEDSFTVDARALVGSDRVDALVDRAGVELTDIVANAQGRWFLDAQARDTALDGDVEAAFDRLYAYPLDGFDARTPVPGNVATARQLAADALLHYLAQQDYLHSEFGRSYLELTHVFRAQHLASLRAFRESVEPEDYSGMPHLDVYIGDWLGAYTEISVEKATGAAVNVYVELD